MVNYVSRGMLGALIAVCIGWTTAPEANAQGADYKPPGFGKRGVGQGDWVFVPPLKSVFHRPRPDYDPNGLRVGSFLFYPELSVQSAYDSNVFAEDSHTHDDVIFTATPAFRVESDWNLHMLGAEGFVTGEKHVKETDEDAIEGNGTLFGRLDITSDDTLFGSASYSHLVDPRSDPNNQNADRTEYSLWTARTGYVHEFARINVRFDGQAQRYDYTDSADNDRDRNQFTIGTRVTYALSPRISPFVEIGFQDQNFDASVDDSGVDRDAQRYSAAVGARVLITDLLLGELAVGVGHTVFEDDTLDDVTSPRVAGLLTWNITELTSIILRARMTQDPTTQAGASTEVILAASARVEHELLRNLLVFGQAGYENDDFEGTNRTDNSYLAGIGAEYLLNRNFSFFGEYDFELRDSNIPGDDFLDNVVLVGARVQY
jgi:hypothetical protein